MRIINQKNIDEVYTPAEAIEDCYASYSAMSGKRVIAPLRTSLETEHQTTLLMPAAVKNETGTDLAVKLLCIVPENPKNKKPLIPGKVCLFDEVDGSMTALMDGFRVTFKRTGAVAGATAKALHPKPVENVVIFGCGAQGYAGLESILYVHPEVKKVTAFDYFQSAAEKYVAFHKPVHPNIEFVLGLPENKEEAVRAADVIHCATTSKEALFDGDWVKNGAHISAIGAYKLDMRELPAELFKRSNVRLFIDDHTAIEEEAGDIMNAVREGTLTEDRMIEFGRFVNKEVEGRQNDDQITIMKAVGVAAQDVIAAKTIYRLCEEKNIGTVVDI